MFLIRIRVFEIVLKTIIITTTTKTSATMTTTTTTIMITTAMLRMLESRLRATSRGTMFKRDGVEDVGFKVRTEENRMMKMLHQPPSEEQSLLMTSVRRDGMEGIEELELAITNCNFQSVLERNKDGRALLSKTFRT